MRRKSERNKAKASPEKKPEKPTRKSTRRRGRRSPSTSPDRENSNDGGALSTRDSDGESTVNTRLQNRDCAKIEEVPENKVSSTGTIVKQQKQQQSPEQSEQRQEQQQAEEDEEDGGSVWKVARADASPGEIQKLKLCRQRNMSETSDASSSRKRTNKWHEGGGESVTEEVDSAEEPSSANRKNAAESEKSADETNSVARGRDTSEEVSDSKEIPPESSSAELSDVKPNIDEDREGDKTIDDETPIFSNALERNDDNEPITSEGNPPESTTTTTTTTTNDEVSNQEPIDEDDTSKVETSAEVELPVEEATKNMENVEKEKEDNCDKITTIDEKVEEPRISKESPSTDEDDKSPEIRENENVTRQRSDSSDDNSDDERKKNKNRQTVTRTTSRRKHRDKYRDSSNSETAESEDDSERQEVAKRAKKSDDNRDDDDDDEDDDDEEDDKGDEEERNETIKASRTPENRSSDTPVDNDVTEQVANNNIDNEKPKDNDNSERKDEIVVTVPTVLPSQNNCKPAKVNLKRSFAGRISAENAETKKEGSDNHTSDLANQDKENHANSEQVDSKSIPKKRRWGTILTSTDPTPAFSVSTESLKVLVPGAKPLSITEVRLSKDDDEEKERRSQREKRYSTGDNSSGEQKSRDDDENPKSADAKKDSKGDNHMASRRKISIIKDTSHAKSPSPPAAQPTSILLIKNLVRPFTLNQIRELLSRTGTIVENGFWMDRIKSKCFVEYSNEDQAFETRQALHGISWPVSNPKRLQVEYATKEDMDSARESSKDQPISRKAEPLAVNDGWQQDWARDERPNAAAKVTVVREWDLGKEDGQHFAKDKEREKKEHEKKRRQRSRSPILEAHLPAPARKFKKKEDDPPPAKLLDDLFRKTKATPCIYWLPLTNEQIVVKEEMRRQHMAEHARRLEEMRRAERNRDGRRRRSPRK